MAALTPEEKELLGPIISPYGRSKKTIEEQKIDVGEIEAFPEVFHDGIEDGNPPEHILVTSEEVETIIKVKGRYEEKCFLWIIDEVSIKISRERTRNTKRTRNQNCICHTNITQEGNAYLGGEMFFGEDGNIYINHFSGRYGDPSTTQWETAKKYIVSVGYTNLVDIIELLKQNL